MDSKTEIRKTVLRARNAMTREEIEAGSRAIVKRLADLEEIRRAATLMVYLAFGSEALTDGLILWGWEAGKRIVVPLCHPESRELTACLIDGFDELASGHYGIREPKVVRPVPRGEIGAVVVPAVAFDRRGYRVGYGGGYYDRFLPQASQAARIGAAFESQIVAAVPADPHDVTVDCIVTETEIICTASRVAEKRPGRIARGNRRPMR
ncbi:MAG: 5-formyltetrahydrofolate cyclo-ligase [Syntrophales bacterium]